jgi:hypothetical protein
MGGSRLGFGCRVREVARCGDEREGGRGFMTTRRETRPQIRRPERVRSGSFRFLYGPARARAAGPIYILGSRFGISDIGGPLVADAWKDQFRDLQCLFNRRNIHLTSPSPAGLGDKWISC